MIDAYVLAAALWGVVLGVVLDRYVLIPGVDWMNRLRRRDR